MQRHGPTIFRIGLGTPVQPAQQPASIQPGHKVRRIQRRSLGVMRECVLQVAPGFMGFGEHQCRFARHPMSYECIVSKRDDRRIDRPMFTNLFCELSQQGLC